MSLNEVWEAASASPFHPLIPKSSQATFGFNCLLIALVATCMFGLNRSFSSLATLGVPAALSVGFGAVATICAVGVYV